MKLTSLQIYNLPKPVGTEQKMLGKKPVSDAQRDGQLREKSKELESVFLTQLIKSMEKTIPEGMGGGKNSLSSMMFSSVLGDAMSQGGGIGLSKMIYSSLKKMDSMTDIQDIAADDFLKCMDVLQNIQSLEESP